MTARRLALAWATGATLGLAVGFLLGESVRDGLDLARLARPEPREGGAGTGTSATEAGNGAQAGAQRPIPTQRDDEPCHRRSPGGGLVCIISGRHAEHAYEMYAPDAKDDADERIE